MQASTELRNVIEDYFRALVSGDPAWTDRYISRRAGVRLVGTYPAEWLEGPRVVEFLREEVKALGGVVQVMAIETEAYREGTVGWGVANPILALPDGRQFSPRWSAVFHQEDGDWKLVQLHASVGVTNEALLR